MRIDWQKYIEVDFDVYHGGGRAISHWQTYPCFNDRRVCGGWNDFRLIYIWVSPVEKGICSGGNSVCGGYCPL